MATQLKGLRLSKIDRVSDGAQPDARITLVKSRAAKAGVVPHVFVPSASDGGECATCGMPPGGDMHITKAAPARTKAKSERTPLSKGDTMEPEITDLAGIDLSGLDDAAREAIEAVVAERDAAIAATPAGTEPVVEGDDDLTTSEGLLAAIGKTRSPEVKRILKGLHANVAKLEEAAKKDRDRAERLEKAERGRVFKSRAEVLKHVAPHAASSAEAADGVAKLAAMLDDVDRNAGHEACEAVENVLTKANTQIAELTTLLTKEHGHSRPVDGDDASPLDKAIAKAREDDPTLTKPQATVRVLDANPALAEYAL